LKGYAIAEIAIFQEQCRYFLLFAIVEVAAIAITALHDFYFFLLIS